MTATCKLCPTIITAPEDNIFDADRDARKMVALGHAVRNHMQDIHPHPLNRAITAGKILEGYMVMQYIDSTDLGLTNGLKLIRPQLQQLLDEVEISPEPQTKEQ